MALVSVPLTCFLSTVILALQPVPVVLLLAETARKVVSYSFAKPAREMLFTQLSSDVKYKSKLVLDTVVQRGGDALGAALFSLLGTHLEWRVVVCVLQSCQSLELLSCHSSVT
jgi:ATP:ADP antiporter, AAA family